MRWLKRLWNVLRPGRLDRDLQRELAFHIAERADELHQSGMSRADAEQAARRQFGNYTSQVERTRDMDLNLFVDECLRNLRYALRSLAKAPAFSATVVLTLALGIGANSAVFSAVSAILLQPLPFPDGDQLVKISQTHPKVAQPFVAPIRLGEWDRLNTTLQGISGYYTEDTSELSGELPEKLKRAFVAPRFLEVLRITPVIGRDFAAGEWKYGGPNAVLISDRLWRRRFGGTPDVIGKSIRTGGAGAPIVGVLPASFAFPDRDVDLWAPVALDAPYAQSREATWFTAVARLKPGVSIPQAQANLAAVQAGLGRIYPMPDADISAGVEPLKEVTVGGARKSLLMLFGSVTLLLLIACTNIAALLLSRASGRQHEISVRFSLGASRAVVVMQLLTETLVLSIAGAALGLLLTAGGSLIFRSLSKDLPRIDEIGLNWTVVSYSLFCAVATTLLCGLLPAIRGTRHNLAGSLAQASRSQVSGRRNRVQFVLVGVQVALAVTLLAGAGLLLRSFQELGRISPGFDATRVLTFHISMSWGETAAPSSRQMMDRILDGLRTIPGVESASSVLSLPGVPGEFQLEMKTPEGTAETEPKMLAQGRFVTPGYFAAMRIPLEAGELCRDEPNQYTTMVNRSFANRYLGGSAAIGRRLLVQPVGPTSRPGEIRGIVGDAKEVGLDRDVPPTVYWCAGASQPGSFYLVRVNGEPSAMVNTIRHKLRELEPRRSVYDLTPLSDHISEAYAQNRLRTVLLVFFALASVSLACVGLYGTLSYLVSLRRREVALRLALGAVKGQVIQQFLYLGVGVSVVGCIAGLLLAAGSSRLLSGMLYGVSLTDGVTLAGVAVIIFTVSMIASLIPAIRAARVEPMQALREE